MRRFPANFSAMRGAALRRIDHATAGSDLQPSDHRYACDSGGIRRLCLLKFQSGIGGYTSTASEWDLPLRHASPREFAKKGRVKRS